VFFDFARLYPSLMFVNTSKLDFDLTLIFHRQLPPHQYLSIADIRKFTGTSTPVSVIGLAMTCNEIKTTGRGEYSSSFKIVDRSCFDNHGQKGYGFGEGMTVTFMHDRKDNVPQKIEDGDVVLIRNIKVSQFKSLSHLLFVLVFSGKLIDYANLDSVASRRNIIEKKSRSQVSKTQTTHGRLPKLQQLQTLREAPIKMVICCYLQVSSCTPSLADRG
jgi:hypothetical protein